MSNHPQLDDVSRDLARARAELGFLRDRLAAEGQALEDRRLRMLIAETPVADRDLHRSAEAVGRLESRIGELEAEVAALVAEERRRGGARGAVGPRA
jgi:hypothetical protein